MTDDRAGLPPHAFAKEDTAPDALFYAVPRFVTHIDERAIAAVTGLYREIFPPGGALLDLMGSWVSHLPQEIAYGHVFGHGMNEAELAANPRYTSWFVQDLNRDPILQLPDATLDGAAICVSIQYLERPVAVLREVARCLKPEAALAITFSNRCFPTKATAIWLGLPMEQHTRLVGLYLEAAGFAAIEPRTLIPEGLDHDPLWAVIGRK
jgi:SAM-dependent methyltransferase